MGEKKRVLGEVLYEDLKTNEYLDKLEMILDKQCDLQRAGQSWTLTQKQISDLLRFADLLSKAFNKAGDTDEKLEALAIVHKLKELYPKRKDVELLLRSVNAQYRNEPFVIDLEVAKLNQEWQTEDE